MNLEIRSITTIPTLMYWRAEVLEHVFGQKPDKRLLVANRQYYRQHIADNTHKAFVASINGEEVGCGAFCITEELPSPDNPSGRCAYLMNIYVREQYRNRGIGHALVKHLISNAKELNCGKIYLETTAQGRPVYKSLGFSAMPDMMILKY